MTSFQNITESSAIIEYNTDDDFDELYERLCLVYCGVMSDKIVFKDGDVGNFTSSNILIQK